MEKTADELQSNGPEPRKGLRSEWIVALAAIVVSVATLFVYIYQARIMQKQQYTSVWPYIEWTLTISTIDGIFLSVKNKGVGPAIIKKTELFLDGKPVASARAMMNELTHGKADSLWSFTETVDDRVMSPGEELRLFHMKGEELLKIDFGIIYNRIAYNITYASVYGECWISSGLQVVKGDCE
jgi:hypothetical protein